MGYQEVFKALLDLAIPERALHAPRFFKAGKGEYGEGDQFIGVTVPDARLVAKEFWKSISDSDLAKGLHSEWHEVRLCFLFILIHHYKAARKNSVRKKALVDLYLSNLEGINNWDLVDSSAPKILGEWLLNEDRTILYELAESDDLWKQRIAMVTTYTFIKNGDYKDTLQLAELLLFHPHDLMHKAVGWMLKEMGSKNLELLRQFLEHHAHHMPRTTLRVSIEKLDPEERRHWMTAKDRI